MTGSPPQRLVAAAPSLLAALLAACAFVPLAIRSHDVSPRPAVWLLAWFAAGTLAVLASHRHHLPAAPDRVSGLAWLAAGAAGAGLLGRHAIDALSIAGAELPLSEPLLAGSGLLGRSMAWAGLPLPDRGDGVMFLVLLALLLPAAFTHALRRPQPRVLGAALVGLGPFAFVVVAALVGGRRDLPNLELGALSAAPFLFAAALAWAPALVGPAALPLDGRRRLSHRVMPRVAAATTLVGLPLGLLALYRGRGIPELGDVVSQRAGEIAAPWFGGLVAGRVGAGAECLLSLFGAFVLVVLCARVAARGLPRLRGAALPLLGLTATGLAAFVSASELVLMAGVAGWFAVLVGAEIAPWDAEALDAASLSNPSRAPVGGPSPPESKPDRHPADGAAP